jgi:hypothetical protein
MMCGAQRSVAVSPRATPWLAAVGGAIRTMPLSEYAAALPTPPSPRLARARPDRAVSRVQSRPRRCPSTVPLSKRTTAIVRPPTPSWSPPRWAEPRAPPLPPFSPSTLAPKLPPLSHPDAGHRRPPEHPPHRRPPPSSRFFHPSRRQETRVSCRLHPLAQRVASPSWMLESLTLFHLRHSSVTASRVVMRARRAVTAPVCAHASRVVRAGGPRARCAGRGQAGPGHGPRACCAVRGQAGPGGAARTPC